MPAVYKVPQRRVPELVSGQDLSLLRGFVQPGTEAWSGFFDDRRFLKRVDADGVATISLTRDARYDPLLFEEEAIGDTPIFVLDGEKKEKRNKVFHLAHLLTDLDLAEKFSITPSLRCQIKAMAAEDVVVASRELQTRVRTVFGYEKAQVVPGKYSQSWKAARDNLRLHAARFPIMSVTTDALFSGEKIFIYGPEGDKGWRVYGSDRVASLVRLVHRMVSATSPQTIIFALGPELTLLDIDIHDGHSVLSPVRRVHAGTHDELPLRSSAEIMSVLSAADRAKIQQLSLAVSTVESDGKAVGSAVRISSKHALTCEHIISEGGLLTVDGKECSPSSALSRDMWLLQADGTDVTWNLRQARRDERVVICYRRFQETHWVGPMRIISADNIGLSYTRHRSLMPGMSGGAVIALSDFSLLGIHDGTAIGHAIGSTFSQIMYTDVWTTEPLPIELEVDDEPTDDILGYKVLDARGFGLSVDKIYSCIEGFSDCGEHKGAFLNVSQHKVYPLAMMAAEDSIFQQLNSTDVPTLSGYGLAVSKVHAFDIALKPPVMRSPVFGEYVALFSRDGEDSISTKGVLVVDEVDPRKGYFSVAGVKALEGVSYLGAVVVAMIDAAVIGVVSYVSNENTEPYMDIRAGMLNESLGLPMTVGVTVRDLSFAVPTADIGRWPDSLVNNIVDCFNGKPLRDDFEAYRFMGESIVGSRFLMANVRNSPTNASVVKKMKRFIHCKRYAERAKVASLHEFVGIIKHSDPTAESDTEEQYNLIKFWFETILGIHVMFEGERSVDLLIDTLYFDMPSG